MKVFKTAGGIFFIAAGVLFIIFLSELNDPEVEGESGKVEVGTYFLSLIPITFGLIILSLKKKK